MEDAAEGRRRLRAAGFGISKRRIFEANTLFDTARGDLWRSDRLLRVRECGAHGKLTYKGASVPGKYKSREELEIEVSDAERLREILSRVDFEASFRYEKYRTEYQRRDESGVATLDETPIGVFLELEGAPAWIDRNAQRLGFTESAYITGSYYALYADYCSQRGLPAGHMTFAR